MAKTIFPGDGTFSINSTLPDDTTSSVSLNRRYPNFQGRVLSVKKEGGKVRASGSRGGRHDRSQRRFAIACAGKRAVQLCRRHVAIPRGIQRRQRDRYVIISAR